ncbi:hypothetical protein HP546_06850 [Pseudomonas sp. CM25]|uniref:membrane-targeted effector domain-containing toxin n=1 Tax=Pseudomonas sp. CM25 TaxID=2738448 RepID=UPI001554A1EC|nr:membrane-targeted effector domain-containing toxin [Pseudomonas sp. CM25]NQD55068.1 hypothetical protein [Pseudomonas sp. CM25]
MFCAIKLPAVAGDEGRIRYTCKWERLSELSGLRLPGALITACLPAPKRTLRPSSSRVRSPMLLSDTQQQDLKTLQQIAMKLSTACPDMLQMARDTALTLLAEHQLDDLEPDQVYFHRFHQATSSPRTFTGWQHDTQPSQTLTLVQLVMRRFSVAEQDASDLLSTYCGFYSKGPGEAAYDERNEIRLLPKDALDYFWSIDFSSLFDQRARDFWTRHGDDYRTLAKATFLVKALETQAHAGNKALAARVRLAAEALAGKRDGAPTLAHLQQTNLPPAGMKVLAFSLGERISSDILRIVMADGYQLLYLPGEAEAFRLFANDRELHAWVLATTLTPAGKARLTSHFPLACHQESSLIKVADYLAHWTNTGLAALLDLMRRQWDALEVGGINTLGKPLHMDAFSYLHKAAQQRMTDDAELALRSNADLRKQLWLGYLSAANTVFGPLTALAWPVALAGVGAGLVEIGLDIDQAINGHTSAERQAGVQNAIFAVINTLMIGLAGATDAGAPASETGAAGPALEPPIAPDLPVEHDFPEELQPATPQEIETWVPKAFQPGELDNQLQALQSNDIVATKAGRGPLEGVHLQNGNFYAMVGDLTYQVRFIHELETWVIVDPETPFSFRQAIPIVRDVDGRWQPHERMGLKGGTPRFLLKAWGRLRPRPQLPPLTLELYDIAEPERSELKPFALTGAGAQLMRDPYGSPLNRAYHQALGQMTRDVEIFYDQLRLPERPAIPNIPQGADARQIIGSLYEEHQGLVMGESHIEDGARQFLTRNMKQFKRQGVKVLYSEHFMVDYQQADMDMFNRTGVLPADLKTYVETWDETAAVQSNDPVHYTLKGMLYEAYSQNIRVQGIDSMLSYRMGWEELPPFPAPRQRMMNYAAQQIITADQTQRGTSKWVALMGNSHANLFEDVPGVSELQGCIGLRVARAGVGQTLDIGIDPGLGVDGGFVRSDLLLSVPPVRS